MPESTAAFHLLRPLWLLALVPAVAIVALVVYRQRAEVQWGHLIAPGLLRFLIVKPQARWHVQPVYLVLAGLVLSIVALSGPTWRRELPPFVEDKAPLIIALAVTSSMTQQDVAPTRLERAKQKVRDLLDARAGARTGLIAYSGTAHLVMPLTDDRAVIEPFLAVLSPALMPSDGKNVASAVALATSSLAAEPVAGTILLVADDLGNADEAALRAAAGRNSIVMLKVAPPADVSGFGEAVRVSVDGSDIQSLERRIETHFQSAQGNQLGARWKDEGFWLLLPAALLFLLWFRRGTTVAWALLFAVILHAPQASAQASSWFLDRWLTPDQEGRLAFDRGDYTAAKTLFADPMWRGLAAYRSYDFLAAAEAFQKVETPQGRFALGNAQAQNHAYEKAIKAYDEVLKIQPGNTAAKINRAIALAALKAAEEKRRKQEEGESPPDEKADETRVDPGEKGGKRIQVKPEDVTTEGAAEAWMREVQTTPADFLKLKFAIQAAAASPLGRGQ